MYTLLNHKNIYTQLDILKYSRKGTESQRPLLQTDS